MRTEPRALVDPDAAPRPAFVLEEAHPATPGHPHRHRRGQLVHAAEGVLVVTTNEGRWVVPPERAVWVPPGMVHAGASRRPYRLRTLYVTPELAPFGPACAVVAVSPLVRELLAAAAALGPDYPAEGPGARLVRVLLDRLPSLAVAPLLALREPTSAGLRAITAALAAAPDDPRPLVAWARLARTTERTLARRFVAETGLTFGRWRQQLRLLVALERLGAGESVTEVAFAVGYHDVSSFIAAFRETMGTTPARYFGR